MKRMIATITLALVTGFFVPASAGPVIDTGVLRHGVDEGYDGVIYVQCRANNDVVGVAELKDSTDYCPGAGRIIYLIVRWERKVTCSNGKTYLNNWPSMTDRYHYIGTDTYIGTCTHQIVSY